MEAAPPLVIFKVFCSEKPTILIRRVTFSSVADVSYSALYSKLSQVFTIKEFKLHYTDVDGDKIVIENDSDLNEAIDYFSSQNDEGRFVVKLSLVKATSSGNAAPQASSTEAAQTSNNENDEQYNQEEFPFEKVINTSIKTVQEMVHNFVSQLSTAIERDLSNLNLGSASTFKDTKRASSFQSFTETRQVPKSESQKSSEPVVHYGVICDCCKSIIRGTRWKCTDCPNYDLCQACKPKSPSIHSHTFHQIPFPVNSGNHSNTTHSATCDYCESVIVGVRHKCINCPDFDLCHNCIALASNQHPYHTFMKIHRPGEPEIKILDVAFHPGIRCDGCGKPINGVRFKCGNCADFDLCGNCEASPTNKHDPDHVFIKFRRPVPSPISASTALLPNFYSRSEHKIYRPRCRQPPSHQRSDNKEMKEFIGSKSSESIGNKSSESIDNKSSESIGSKSSEKSSQNFFNSIVESVNIGPSTDRPVISRAPIDLYRTSNISSSSSLVGNQEPKQVQIPTFASTSGVPTSPPIEEIKPETERQIIVEPILDAQFIQDVNIPDGTVLEPQTQFHKIWRMINNGNVNWPESTTLQHVGGSPMVNEAMPSSESGKIEFKVGSHEVGQTICVAADLRAPSEPGKYISRWCLTDGQGNLFGHQVWCEIIVESDEQSSNMSSSSMIFPVLNYDQKSAFVESNAVSEQSSYISNSIASSEINLIQNEDEDPFQDPISPDSTVAELTKNPMETEDDDNVETFDSDEESEISSIASSDDSSQDFIVVDKESDDEMELSQSQQSLFGRQTSRENVHVTRSE